MTNKTIDKRGFTIFKNPHLIDEKGNSLNESVGSEFEFFIEELWE